MILGEKQILITLLSLLKINFSGASSNSKFWNFDMHSLNHEG